MAVTIERIQHPVGQGFFNTTDIRDASGEIVFSAVYDCGAMSTYNAPLAGRIDEYLAARGDRRVDVVFVSHWHVDHIAGLPRLLDPAKGLKADAVIVPLTTPLDRIISFAENERNRRSGRAVGFQIEAAADPLVAVSELAENVVTVAAGGGGARGNDGDIGGDRGQGGGWDGLSQSDRIWALVGPFQPRVDGATTTDSSAVVIRVPDVAPDWQFSLYIDPAHADAEGQFLAFLAAALGEAAADIDAKLLDPDFLRWLFSDKRDVVLGAYQEFHVAHGGTINGTSLSVLSGPQGPATGRLDWSHGSAKGTSSSKFGWLATGDAELKAKGRRDEFLSHFGALLGAVHTFAPPHHGSNNNYHRDLLAGVAPELGVVGADRYQDWIHPGDDVRKGFAAAKIPLRKVTARSRPLSEVITLN